MKIIETQYKGYLFRSRLEARWAVFDECGVNWEYEPEGYVLDNGQWYLPDFLLHDVDGRVNGDLYVEVKGKMTEEDAKKINAFSGIRLVEEKNMSYYTIDNPILVIGNIPSGETMEEIDSYCQDVGYTGFPDIKGGPYPFNFQNIDGDYFVAHLGVNKAGRFELFGDEGSYLNARDSNSTYLAFIKARTARFEHRRTHI